jgi:hypothetical protein
MFSLSPKHPVLLPFSLKLRPHGSQRTINQCLQSAYIELLKCAQAQQIFIPQSTHLKRPHPLSINTEYSTQN